MENEQKKISFGYSKTFKKPNLLNKQPEKPKTVELIECLEGKSIKVIGGEPSKVKEPLVIPMKHPNKQLINLIDIVKNNFETPLDENKEETSKKEDVTNENLSLDEQAARELLNEGHNVIAKEENKRIIDINNENVTFEGEIEPTIKDYENVPIEEYGKAMLRGMGWKDGEGIGKKQQIIKMTQPVIRPKGMGLGADKVTKQDNIKPAVDRDGNALKCVKGAFIKIIAGYYKGKYGQIIGLDDESGRFIIKTALNNLNVSLNEFLVVPVTREEYSKNSKVINNDKYEEYYKKKEIAASKKENIKKEKYSDSSDDEHKRKPDKIKKEKFDRKQERKSKSSESDYEETKNRKYNEYYKNNSRKDSSEDEYKKKSDRSKRDKYDYVNSKRENIKKNYSDSSEDEYKSKEKYDRNYKKNSRENDKYSDDSDSDESRKTKKKLTKYDSDFSSDEQKSSRKRKHKKKKSERRNSEEEEYKKRNKKIEERSSCRKNKHRDKKREKNKHR